MNKLSERQARVLLKLQDRIHACLTVYETDRDEGFRRLTTLCLAENIRGARFVRALVPTRTKSNTVIEKIIQKITRLYSYRNDNNKQEQINFIKGILESLGGVTEVRTPFPKFSIKGEEDKKGGDIK